MSELADGASIKQHLIQMREELIQKISPLLTGEQAEIIRATEISWSTRLRTALGRAYYATCRRTGRTGRGTFFDRLMAHTFGDPDYGNPSARNRIELNARVLAKHPEEIAPTFAHELAHIVAPMLFGKQGHNHQPGWVRVMELFGYPPERTHNLDVSELHRRQKPVAIALCGCPGGEHEIKARRYQKMRRGRVKYVCLKCNEPLHLVMKI